MTATLPRNRAVATSNRTPRMRAVLLVALVTALGVPIVSSGAQTTVASCNVANQIVPAPPSWEAITKPAFAVGPATMSAFAAQPTNPDVIYVTNGKAVMRSSDSGCHWDEVLELRPEGNGDVPLSSAVTTITAITIPERDPKRRVLLSMVEVEEGIGRPHVAVSESGDAGSYDLADTGLPAVGRPTDLRIAPSDPRVVLLALRAVPSLNDTPVGTLPPVGGTPAPSAPGGALYRSNDGGRTWAVAAEGGDLGGAAVIDDIAISNLAAERVWVIADGVLLRSDDQGSSFTDRGLTQAQQDEAGYHFTAIDTYQSRVLAFSRTSNSGSAVVLRSDNSGTSYTSSNIPFAVDSAAHGTRVDDVLVGTPVADGASSLYQLSNRRWTTVAPTSLQTTWRIQITRVRAVRFGLSPEKLYRTIADRTAPKLGDPPVPVDDIDGLAGVKPASLLPRSQTVTLQVGQTREIQYTLRVPRRPTPLDVYIVLDNSGSMAAFIDNLRLTLASAVNALRANAVDVNVGLGYYTSLTDQKQPMYDRLVDIGPVNQAFFAALDKLDPKSTQGNQEPILDALYQSATGEGRSDIKFQALSTCDIDPSLPGCGIPRNRNANFRRDSLRVLLHAGNEEWDRGLEGSPTFAETAAALRSRNIKHVGIAVLPIAKRDMGEMSQATGAIAAPGGVDCSGDGVADLKAGAGLVCGGTSADLAKTLVQILNAVSDVQDLRFYSRNPSPVLRSLQPTRVLPVNVKTDSSILMRATVSCLGVEPGSYELRFGAALKEATIAEASALVTCGAPPALAAVIPPVAPPQQQPAPVQPPGVPVPVPAPAPQINPAPQAQPQIQANANAGTAFEEQEQIQIATVGLDIPKESEELAMSALPPPERSDAVGAAVAVLAAGGLMGSVCMGVVLARRQRTALAHSRTFR